MAESQEPQYTMTMAEYASINRRLAGLEAFKTTFQAKRQVKTNQTHPIKPIQPAPRQRTVKKPEENLAKIITFVAFLEAEDKEQTVRGLELLVRQGVLRMTVEGFRHAIKQGIDTGFLAMKVPKQIVRGRRFVIATCCPEEATT